MLNEESKVLLIINPTAGKKKSKNNIEEIVTLLKKYYHNVTPLITNAKGDATNFVNSEARNYDMMICCGGDGTLNEVVSGLMSINYDIPIGYIPAGTTNDLARTFNIPKDIKKSIKFIYNGKLTYHDIGIINDKNYFSYVSSFGAFTKVSYATPQWLKNRLGHFAYILDGIKSVGDIKPYKVKIKTEEFEIEDEFIFGSISNSLSIGGILQLNKDEVSLNDGKFEVLLIRNPHNPLELRGILYGLIHKKYDKKYILFSKVKHIFFEFERDTDWSCDGEYVNLSKVIEIKNCKNAIQFIR